MRGRTSCPDHNRRRLRIGSDQRSAGHCRPSGPSADSDRQRHLLRAPSIAHRPSCARRRRFCALRPTRSARGGDCRSQVRHGSRLHLHLWSHAPGCTHPATAPTSGRCRRRTARSPRSSNRLRAAGCDAPPASVRSHARTSAICCPSSACPEPRRIVLF